MREVWGRRLGKRRNQDERMKRKAGTAHTKNTGWRRQGRSKAPVLGQCGLNLEGEGKSPTKKEGKKKELGGTYSLTSFAIKSQWWNKK